MKDLDLNRLRKFVIPEIIFGEGALDLIGQTSGKYGDGKIMVVTDPGVIKAKWCQRVIDCLEESAIEYVVFSNVTSNPKELEVMAGAELFRSEECTRIIAIGGGSPMDCAKGIGIVASNGGHILDYEGVDRIEVPIPPLICIPTTSGSSADVSQFAIIMDQTKQTKIAIISKAIVPDLALIDPRTLLTTDPYDNACAVIDALSHAIEAYVSNASGPITDIHSLEAIRLINMNLRRVVEDLENINIRTELMRASMEAGMAFSNASLGAVHALARSLGGLLDVPHGECNALLLESVIEFNYELCPERYIRIGQAMGLDLPDEPTSHSKGAIIRAIHELRVAAGINGTLKDMGVKPTDIPDLAKRALDDPCLVTNPSTASLSDIERIYKNAF